jgi:hypothetical protein
MAVFAFDPFQPRFLAGVSAAIALCAAFAYAPSAQAEPRVRGGFSINGGYFGAASKSDQSNGGAISLGGRIGVQLSDVFSLYYQNTPMGWILLEGGARVGGSDYNSVLADFTIEDTLGLGIGPSCDLVTVGQLRGRGSLVEPGAHARVSLLLGGSSGISRRQAFSIGLDPHVTYFNSGVLVSVTAGIGAEWY